MVDIDPTFMGLQSMVSWTKLSVPYLVFALEDLIFKSCRVGQVRMF